VWTMSKVRKYGGYVEIIKPRGPNEGLSKLVRGMPRAMLQSLKHVKNIDVLISTAIPGGATQPQLAYGMWVGL